LASLGVSLDRRGSGQSDNVGCEPRHRASKDTLSEPNSSSRLQVYIRMASGPKPTPQQVAEMDRYRGITYKRNGNNNQGRPQGSILGMPPPPPNPMVHTSSDLNIDLGGWLSNAKMLVHVSEIMKIPSQREKLLRAIENPSQNNVDIPPAVAYQDAPVILQNMDRGNEKNRPFYLSLLMNDFILHNCMLDSGTSSNVMTKKVMEQLNLRISRPYHNICAMDSKTIQVHGLIKGLQVHLAAFPDIMIEIDIVVIDVPDAWGMLLSRKTTADLGGNLQMEVKLIHLSLLQHLFIYFGSPKNAG
jgi:hypothetical protein